MLKYVRLTVIVDVEIPEDAEPGDIIVTDVIACNMADSNGGDLSTFDIQIVKRELLED